MCGFIGTFGHQNNQTKYKIENIEHRGPDQKVSIQGSNWKVDFVRLAINDLSVNGNQPFKVGKITAFINGEIYNSEKLRNAFFKHIKFLSNSDCEVIPHMYKKFGINFIDKLDGFFSILIIDENENKLFLIKDSFGKKPLYYNHDPENNHLSFCSENRIYDEKSKINNLNFINLFTFHFKFFNQTIFDDIKAIPPGSFLEYSNKKINIVQWYIPKILKINNDNIKDKFLKLFEASIKKRLMSDVKIGLFLSGGLDSNLIASTLKKITNQKIATFSAIIEKKEFQEKNHTDTEGQIKKSLNNLGPQFEENLVYINNNYINKNFVCVVSEFDNPILDSSGAIVLYSLAESAKLNNCKVVLSGLGGDECFGGYQWQSRYKKNNKFLNKIIYLLSRLNFLFLKVNNKYINYIFFPFFLHLTSLGTKFFKSKDLNFVKKSKDQTLRSISDIVKKNSKFFRNDFSNFLDYINIYGVLNHQVSYIDLVCMKNSIENRSPFLDKELFEYCLSIPSSYKSENKKLLREYCKNICPDYIVSNLKSGPTINFSNFFNEQDLTEKSEKFIQNNLYILEKYISKDLANKIRYSSDILRNENYAPMANLISVIVWVKYNLEKSIKKNITFEELVSLQ